MTDIVWPTTGKFFKVIGGLPQRLEAFSKYVESSSRCGYRAGRPQAVRVADKDGHVILVRTIRLKRGRKESGLGYNEITLTARVERESDLDPAGYLAANPDIQAAGANPADHFRKYGKTEDRNQYQFSRIAEQRRIKLQRIALNRQPVSTLETGALYFITDAEKKEFGLPDHIPVAENEYNPEVVALIRANPDAIILDIGAGLRHTCYSNVITTEIWPSPCPLQTTSSTS
jgi:hypothetical protein